LADIVVILFLVQRKTNYLKQNNTKILDNKKGYSNKTIYVMTCKILNIGIYQNTKLTCMVNAP